MPAESGMENGRMTVKRFRMEGVLGLVVAAGADTLEVGLDGTAIRDSDDAEGDDTLLSEAALAVGVAAASSDATGVRAPGDTAVGESVNPRDDTDRRDGDLPPTDVGLVSTRRADRDCATSPLTITPL